MLGHKTIYEKSHLIAKQLPYTAELQEHHRGGFFPLLQDPALTKEACIIGMFVLRPGAVKAYTADLLDGDGEPTSLFDPSLDWSFNWDGLDGGWLVADGSALDAYRLGMQYGLADAVMVASQTVMAEGVGKPAEGKKGYVWQPYNPFSWGHVQAAEPEAMEKIFRQRKLWQELGHLSPRRYPAQMVFTWTGEQHAGFDDFLSADLLHMTNHPTGEPVECYIVTTEKGAAVIRARAPLRGLGDRIDSMLIIVPPPAGTSTPEGQLSDKMDISLLPKLLYDKYDIRIVNHDGGQRVLRAFSQAGALHQMNLTFARQKTLMQALQDRTDIDPEVSQAHQANYAKEVSFFFDRDNKAADSHGMPACLTVAALIADDSDKVAIATIVLPKDQLDWWN